MHVLVFAPHNDDEVLGVGGTIKKLVNAGESVFICEVTSGPHYRLLQDEAQKAHELLGIKQSFFLNRPVGMLKSEIQMELNKAISDVIEKIRPEVVFTPFLGDMHIDHREVTESVMVGVRPIGNYSVREIYMYETLSETGWNVPTSERTFSPNVWVDISETIQDKIQAMKCYHSQLKEYPHPRSEEAIIALAKYRGSTIFVPYAESFMLVRKVGL